MNDLFVVVDVIIFKGYVLICGRLIIGGMCWEMIFCCGSMSFFFF